MKNFIHPFALFLCIGCMCSCSKDDDGSEAPIEIPADQKLLGSVEGSGALNFDASFEYNPDKTVDHLNIASAFLFDFSYISDRIASIELAAGGELRKYAFAYSAEGRVTSYSMDEVLIPVDYDPIDNAYHYLDQYDREVTISLTSEGDIRQYSIMDNVSGDRDSAVLDYDQMGKGSMANGNAISLHLGIVLGSPDAVFYIYPFTKRPVRYVSTSDVFSVVFENVYDGQDFVISTSMVVNGEEANNGGTSAFKYIALD
ncbi:MAG: hypothetical protein V7724_04335 [Sediminicola sp.]